MLESGLTETSSPILTAFETQKLTQSPPRATDMELAQALEIVLNSTNYKLLTRVPEAFEKREPSHQSPILSAVIIDLETTGLHADTDAIIELGLLKFSFDADGIIELLDSYNEFNDPNAPISEEITKITGITTSDVVGKIIDWEKIENLVTECDFVICHNSNFDRKFLEAKTPEAIQALFKSKSFACTMQDIDWSSRRYDSRKLKHLNLELGYFFDGHRALNDCWATLNLLRADDRAWHELSVSMQQSEYILYAIGAAYNKNEVLKQRKYTYFRGSEAIKKCWKVNLPSDVAVMDEIALLEKDIYGGKGICGELPVTKITAQTRYSSRVYEPNMKVYQVQAGIIEREQIIPTPEIEETLSLTYEGPLTRSKSRSIRASSSQ